MMCSFGQKEINNYYNPLMPRVKKKKWSPCGTPLFSSRINNADQGISSYGCVPYRDSQHQPPDSHLLG